MTVILLDTGLCALPVEPAIQNRFTPFLSEDGLVGHAGVSK